jgi:hypothetical protein
MGRYLGRYIASWVGSGYLRGVGYTTTTNNRFPHTHPSLGPTNVIQMRTRNISFVDFHFFLVSFGGRERQRVCVHARAGPTYVLRIEDKEEFVREFVDGEIFLVSFR